MKCDRGLDEENLVAVLLADVVETNHVRAKKSLDCVRKFGVGGIAALLCHVVRGMEEAIGVVARFERVPVTGIQSA